MNLHLNARGFRLAELLEARAEDFRVAVSRTAQGSRIIDAGVAVPGGLHAGLMLSHICLADLGLVSIQSATLAGYPLVQVTTDQPVAACLASQYAGWMIKVGNFFAMGSGPMRAAYGREELYKHIGCTELVHAAIGCLETKQLPNDDVALDIASKCNVSPEHVTLLVAPTTSMAGTLQVVARSVETCLHKLHELKFDVLQVKSGHGTAPLPPVAKRTNAAIGRTNDAILYGGMVTLWVDCPDDFIAEVGPKVPASASPDYGVPFAELFEKVGGDFYKIDPLLFSPARVTFNNLQSGRMFTFGQVNERLLNQSFSG
ncbi:MAG: methenyltetrahydromethanopterin cyclohydrolase [Planctomycetia bacterium]|nr:methenyltetrahydromethanopterin cyclohydrolase [Planctomycetia bacterium]